MLKKIFILLALVGLSIEVAFSQEPKWNRGNVYQYVEIPEFFKVQKPKGFFPQKEAVVGKGVSWGSAPVKASELAILNEKKETVGYVSDFVWWCEYSVGTETPTVVLTLPNPDALIIPSKDGLYYEACTVKVKQKDGSVKRETRPNRIKMATKEEADKFMSYFKKSTQQKQETYVSTADDFDHESSNSTASKVERTRPREGLEKMSSGQVSLDEGLSIARKMTNWKREEQLADGEVAEALAVKQFRITQAYTSLAPQGGTYQTESFAVNNQGNSGGGYDQRYQYEMMMQQQQLAEDKRQRRISNGIAVAGLVLSAGAVIFQGIQQNRILRSVAQQQYQQPSYYSQPYYPQGRYGQQRNWGNNGSSGTTVVVNNTNTNTNTNNPFQNQYNGTWGGGRPVVVGGSKPQIPPRGHGWGSGNNPPWNQNIQDRGLPLMNGPTNYDRRWTLNHDGRVITPYDPRIGRNPITGAPEVAYWQNPNASNWTPTYNNTGVQIVRGADGKATGVTVPYGNVQQGTNTYYIPPVPTSGNGAGNSNQYIPLPATWGGGSGNTTQNPIANNTNTGTYIPTNNNGGGGTGGW